LSRGGGRLSLQGMIGANQVVNVWRAEAQIRLKTIAEKGERLRLILAGAHHLSDKLASSLTIGEVISADRIRGQPGLKIVRGMPTEGLEGVRRVLPQKFRQVDLTCTV